MVHRNLIMPVNFLPVWNGSSEAESCGGGTTSGDADDSRGDALERESVAVCVSDPDDRTVAWVSGLPAPEEGRSEGLEDVHSVLGGTITDMSDSSNKAVIPLDVLDKGVSAPLTLSRVDTQQDHETNSLVGPLDESITPLDTGRAVTVRTRGGRVVRPLIRFIQNMQQRVFAGL